MPFMGLLVDWTQLRKKKKVSELEDLQKPPKEKIKEDKDKKRKQRNRRKD